MNKFDVRLYEVGSGGDFQIQGNDFIGCFSFENFPYLAMFGGNPLSITSEKTEGEESFDYWGNTLLFENNPEVQFNSRTERTLQSVALNSTGRKLIEEAVNADLEFMQAFAEVSVSVTIPLIDKVVIDILLKEPSNGVEKRFTYIWDGAKLIDESITEFNSPEKPEGLQAVLQFELG